jgi:hypothetical protein
LFWSLCYLAFRCVLQLAFLRRRSEEFKDLEIVVLRHELSALRRQKTATAADDDRSGLSCRGEPAVAAGRLARSASSCFGWRGRIHAGATSGSSVS